jgi:hypothetical protein
MEMLCGARCCIVVWMGFEIADYNEEKSAFTEVVLDPTFIVTTNFEVAKVLTWNNYCAHSATD